MHYGCIFLSILVKQKHWIVSEKVKIRVNCSRKIFFSEKKEDKLEKTSNLKCGDWGKVNFCGLKCYNLD